MFRSGMEGIHSELDHNAIYPIEIGKKLLKGKVYQDYIESVSKIIHIKSDIFDPLYRELMENYAQFVQHLEKPRDKMKDRLLHSSLRRAYGFIKQVAPLVETKQGFGFDHDRLMYTLYSAALLNSIGRTFQDRTVTLCDESGKHLGAWFPNSGLLKEGFYRVRATRSLPEEYVRSLHLVYAQVVMPKMGLAWILEEPTLFLWWVKALEDLQKGFGDLEIDFSAMKDLGEEFKFDKGHQGIHPPQTAEGEKFLAWLQDKIKKEAQKINQEGSGMYHGKEGLYIELDQLISEYTESRSVGKASSKLIKEQFEALGIANPEGQYTHPVSGGFLQGNRQKAFKAALIEYEKGLFESGTLGPVLQVASQSQVTSGERFFSRVGGLAMQFMMGHTQRKG